MIYEGKNAIKNNGSLDINLAKKTKFIVKIWFVEIRENISINFQDMASSCLISFSFFTDYPFKFQTHRSTLR